MLSGMAKMEPDRFFLCGFFYCALRHISSCRVRDKGLSSLTFPEKTYGTGHPLTCGYGESKNVSGSTSPHSQHLVVTYSKNGARRSDMDPRYYQVRQTISYGEQSHQWQGRFFLISPSFSNKSNSCRFLKIMIVITIRISPNNRAHQGSPIMMQMTPALPMNPPSMALKVPLGKDIRSTRHPPL